MDTYSGATVNSRRLCGSMRGRGISIQEYEVRVYGGDCGTGRYVRQGAVTLATSSSGHGCPGWMTRIAGMIGELAVPAVAESPVEYAGHDSYRVGQWILRRTGSSGSRIEVSYLPYGDERDAAQFERLTNQELRWLVYAACGDRLIPSLGLTMRQQDDYGTLYDSSAVGRLVRVVCPSTGAVYWLPVLNAMTAKEAVAETFGLREVEYSPAVEA